tara:strand:+ start:815 stop:1201 length:387 start_codon:yes stop_codon:yes gene_type:complete
LKYILIKLIISFIVFNIFSCESKDKKYQNNIDLSVDRGEKLFNDMACNACHTINGSLRLGPSLQSQFGKEILHTDGTISIVDEKYIEESINFPLKHIVEGYTPIMPSYAPILNEKDIQDIISYIKTLN